MSTTTVSGTVVDPDGIAWANGTVTFQLINPNPQIAPNVGGVPLTIAQTDFTIPLDGTGSFSQAVTSTSSITPALTQWRITFDSNTSAVAQALNVMPINGTTQSLNTQIAAQIQVIRLSASPSTRAYADIEIMATPPAGATYYNTTTNVTRLWTGATWINAGLGGGASVTLEQILPGPGAYTFNHNLNSLNYILTAFARQGSGYGAVTVASIPIDANNASVIIPAAGDYICCFAATPAIIPDFFIITTPTTAINFQPTMSGTQQILITVNQSAIGGYSSTVTYSITAGLPTGVTGVFAPTTITGTGTSTLTLSFPSTQASSTFTLTIQGTDGVKTHSVNTSSITIGNINQGLIEGWQMNDGSGSAFADSAGTSNTETIVTGSLTWGTNTGFPGSSASFSGYTHGANHTATNFDGTAAFSVAAWVNLPAAAGEVALVSTLNPSNNFQGWELNASPSPTNFFPEFFLINTYPTNCIQVKGNNSFAPSSGIHHMVVTYSAATKTASDVVFYLDGVQLTNQTPVQNNLTLSTANAINANFMARQDGTDPGASGSIMAAVRIWNRVLSSTDVTNYFNAGVK